MGELKLSCKCGKVTGRVEGITPDKGNYLVCYCADCQAFSNHLSADPSILNEFGGTDVLQVAPSMLKIEQGAEYLACLRLRKKGLYRWYTSCCNTPVANTIALKVPFVGIIHSFFAPDQNIQATLGPLIGAFNVQGAKQGLPDRDTLARQKFKLMWLAISKILKWKIQGKGRPNPFFGVDGRAIVKPIILEKSAQ
ncbi:MAG: hypothetical protein HRU05_03660 [Oceanospirillaceae bacterium]|nr:hypothetical protein [Oceanospirillaceae bacterium]